MRSSLACSSLVSLGVALSGAGCWDDVPKMPPTALSQAKLVPLTGCTDVVAAARAKALAEMNQRLEVNLKQALDSASATTGPRVCPRPGVGAGYSSGAAGPGANGAPPAPAPSAPSSSEGDRSSSASSYSGTNNQIAGVDEPDFVKNDGKYIYLVAGNQLRIVEAWPPESARTISRFTIAGQARKLYVTQNRAVVYSSLDPGAAPSAGAGANPAPAAAPKPSRGGQAKECTYGYDCELTGDGRPTQITVLDISDRAAPVVLREIATTGSFVSARRVGNAAFTVLASMHNPFPEVADWPADLPGCWSAPLAVTTIQQSFARLRDKNRGIIEAASVDGFLPVVRDTSRRPGAQVEVRDNVLGDCRRFYSENIGTGDAFTSVLAFDIDRDEGLASATVYSRPGAVYASAGALYFSVPHRRDEGMGWYRDFAAAQQVSTVHKFNLITTGAVNVAYAGSGVVKGRVLNQFGMDEHRGDLRIATTSGRVPEPGVHSTMSVLADVEGALEVVGQVDKLAPGEDIRSVRFDGDRGYVVTFKKTDPLFVFDLADPRAPRVEAELKIPGFSTYMHRMDANHLLTIGYDAADQGSFAYFTGVMLQIFDVSDPKAPYLKHKVVIGSRGSSSEALTNHLAFNYYPPRDLLLLPMTICELPPGSTNLFGARPTFSGLLAWNVTAGAGFSDAGRVSHPSPTSVNCGNWWTNASSQVQRSIVMEDFVFSVSGSQIKVNRLGSLTSDVASVSLAD
jgi:hypothetical protein